MKKTTLYNLIATFFITMGVSSCADFLPTMPKDSMQPKQD